MSPEKNKVVVSNPWFYRPNPNRSCSLRLFCIPHAGGSASTFRDWPHRLPSCVEVWGIQLPGRESRFEELPYTQLLDLVKALANAIGPCADVPFALFGHSMGALIAFALARELRRLQLPNPVHLIVSGRRAPQLPNNGPPIHNLPKEQFLQEVSEFNGMMDEVFQHEELRELLLPVLRADFKMCETYEYVADEPLDCSISVFGGMQDDDVSRDDLTAWRQQTRRAFDIKTFPGDHFYLHTDPASFLRSFSLQLHHILVGQTP